MGYRYKNPIGWCFPPGTDLTFYGCLRTPMQSLPRSLGDQHQPLVGQECWYLGIWCLGGLEEQENKNQMIWIHSKNLPQTPIGFVEIQLAPQKESGSHWIYDSGQGQSHAACLRIARIAPQNLKGNENNSRPCRPWGRLPVKVWNELLKIPYGTTITYHYWQKGSGI